MACARLSGFSNVRLWAAAVCLLAWYVAFRPVYRRLEKVLLVMVAVLSVCFLTLAVWSGPSAPESCAAFSDSPFRPWRGASIA